MPAQNFITRPGSQFIAAGTGAVERTVEAKLQDVVSVLDFIPESEHAAIKAGTSTYDATADFNAALRASETYGDSLKHICLQLGGWHYYILGTVYLRKGQVIEGGGAHLFMSASGSIKLGYKSDDTEDPGGAPPGVHNLWIEGGFAPISANISGYQVSNVFISFSAVGAVFRGTDGSISDCIFDAGARLCSFGGRSMTMTNCNFYVGNEQLNITNLRDSVISNCVFNYANIAAIQIDGLTGQSNLNVRIDNCSFKKNEQSAATFNGFVHTRNLTASPAGDVTFSNCSFRNCYQAAINIDGTGSQALTFKDCEFNGLKTNNTYAQSSTMYALDMTYSAAGGNVTMDGCRFLNLFDTPIQAASTEAINLTVTNSLFSNNAGTVSIELGSLNTGTCSFTLGNIIGDTQSNVPLFSVATAVPLKIVGYLKDWLKAFDDGVTYQYVEVPFTDACLVSAVLRANQNPGGSALYRAFKKCTASISYDYTGVTATRATIQDDFKSDSPILGFDLNLQAAITDIATGSAVAGNVKPGKLVLYWPRGYGSETIDVQYELS